MAELHIAGLTKRFGGRMVLDGISLGAAPGELVVVLGASGCGKTTLLRLIAGFARADAGTIEIARVPVTAPGLHQPPERRRIGYLAQEGALFPHLTVAGNIGFGLKRRPDRDRRIAELLDMVGLPQGYGKRFPHQLSGGEQQRVALARALAPTPRLMLLDEPFSSLDAALRQEIRQAVAAALKRAGTTALLVTHDQAEALSMGDRVAVLRGGRIVQLADPVSLYRCPVDPALAQFVGEAVLLPGTAAGGIAHCSLGAFAIAAGGADGRVAVMIRPEQVRLVPPGTPGSVRARVSDVTFCGHDAMVRLTLPEMPDAAVSARLFSQDVPMPGQPVGVAIAGPVITYPELLVRPQAGSGVTLAAVAG
jgi:iron(III) transport system ATP-binding protein